MAHTIDAASLSMADTHARNLHTQAKALEDQAGALLDKARQLRAAANVFDYFADNPDQ